MTEYDVHITQAAEVDLISALNYLEQVLKSPQAADALLDEFTKAAASLRIYPARYGLAEDSVLHAWGIRFVPVRNYLLFYNVQEAQCRVNIIRFLYGKRNWKTILGSSLAE